MALTSIAVRVGQREPLDGAAVGQLPERLARDRLRRLGGVVCPVARRLNGVMAATTDQRMLRNLISAF